MKSRNVGFAKKKIKMNQGKKNHTTYNDQRLDRKILKIMGRYNIRNMFQISTVIYELMYRFYIPHFEQQ